MAAEDIPDEPLQPDRPQPLPKGFRSIPDLDMQDEAVVIDGFRLLPLGDLTAGGRALEFHPKALVGVAWDSNPLPVESGAEGDLRTHLAVGAELRAVSSAGWRTDLDGTLILQQYADTPSRNDTAGNARARTRFQGQTTTFAADAGWDLSREPVSELPEQVRRERYDASVAAGGERRLSRWSGRLAFASLDYLEDSPYFTSDQRDYRRWTASAAWSALGGDDSLLGIEGSIDDTQRDAVATANPWSGVTLAARWRHSLGDRSTVDCRLGGTVREFDDDSAHDPANDDRTIAAPVAGIRLDLPWENGSHASVSISTGLAEGLNSTTNASRRHAIEASLRMRLADRVNAVGQGWFVRRVDSAPTSSGGQTEAVDDLYIRLGLEYRLRDGIGLRLWSSVQHRTADVGFDYDRTLFAAELAAAL
jgi:hypothetical protein